MNAYAIVLGGGSGVRMGLEMNKVLAPLRGVPAIVRAIAPFTGLCAGVVVVARADEIELMKQLLTRYGLIRAVCAIVPGGEDRQSSVANGLDALPLEADTVLIHDGARALVTEDVIRRALEAVQTYGSGVASVKVTDTIKRIDTKGYAMQTLNRDELRAMQTPQAFRLQELKLAHAMAARDNYRATDDAELLTHAGLPVYLYEGSHENLKLTTPFDLRLAEVILAARDEGANA